MFAVGFGISNREKKIRVISKSDPNHGLILAAVHFEWVIKRTILKLGQSPTARLRGELEGIYKLGSPDNKKDYRSIWKREVASRFKNAQLGIVLGNLHTLESKTLKIRGQVIHGNGTVPKANALDAINEFLKASKKLYDFASKNGEDLDEILRRRIKARD